MSINVCIGHTGQRLQLDPGVTSTLDALRTWIATNAAIQPRNQILLTSQGKQVRTQTLLTETEIFVFDSDWLHGRQELNRSGDVGRDGGDETFVPGDAPYAPGNQSDPSAWQELFYQRSKWVTTLLEGCSRQAAKAEQYQDEQVVIERSLNVAVTSLQHHIKTAEKQNASFQSWSNEVLQEQRAHADSWEHNLASLRNIAARSEFGRFIDLRQSDTASRRRSLSGSTYTLQSFVDVASVQDAAAGVQSQINNSTQKLNTLRRKLDQATSDSEKLLRAVEQNTNKSVSEASTDQPGQVVAEVEAVVKKINGDYEHFRSTPFSAQYVAQATKIASLHTKSYIPALVEYCGELNDLVERNRQQRQLAADTALDRMSTLSAVESQLASIFQEMKELEVPEEHQRALEKLTIVSRLPSVYGQLLVESVRRREWVAKMKRDSATLQEEVAVYQEEEEKRRKKWVRGVDDVVSADALQSRVLGIDLSLQNEGGSWPAVSREDLAEYQDKLRQIYGQGPVTEELEQAIKDLDRPTRKQIKHAKAFKHGSLHEAAFGDTSLLLRGDEQHKSLREANIRLEEDVRAQKSRVRKLEDLLHRSTQATRSGLGEAFGQSGDGLLPSLRPGSPGAFSSQLTDLGRRESIGQLQRRRQSLVHTPSTEEKKLAKRIVDLETELQASKDQLAARDNAKIDLQKHVDEAISTKQDLMRNMEAQQKEFANDRRNLEKELAEAREKIEETENEMERILGSRDGVDDEIIRLKEDAAGHAARAATEHDARLAMEKKLSQAEGVRANVEEQLQQVRLEQQQGYETDAEIMQILAVAHAHLAPHSPTATGIAGLAAALEELARQSVKHVKDLQDAVAFAKSENESLWSSNERQKTELNEAAQRQTETESAVRKAQDDTSAEQARAKALETQLHEEQAQLRSLQSKFADGETGSEVLRQRLIEAETKVNRLTADLATERSHGNSLDVEIMRLQKQQQDTSSNAMASATRMTKRTDRVKDLSQRLYQQNLRLSRLLERLGLAISYNDSTMVVERASKMNASTANVTVDGGQLMRTVSLTSPPPTRKSSNVDPEPPTELRLLRWPDALSATEEDKQYEAFLNLLARFDLEVFGEAVTKRVKDFEYTAKKYSKEAKESIKRADAYKERAMKHRSEAHGKIAVRDFKEGDLALFLPTRGGQVKGAWAAFNIGCPHYFLAERDGMRLGTRDFIVARIQKVEQKVVDLSGQRTAHLSATAADGRSFDERYDIAAVSPSVATEHDDNPFDLSDGLTWWLVHASEERVGGAAPTTPGLGKSTVAAANVDVKGSIRVKRSNKNDDASKHLNKSLDSRRSSTASSKRNVPANVTNTTTAGMTSAAVSPNSLIEPPRQRSVSQASSLKPLPGPAVARSPPNPGLGITDATSNDTTTTATQQKEETIHPSPNRQPPPPPSSDLPQSEHHSTQYPPQQPILIRTKSQSSDPRAQSPSKSVRSLQRHLADHLASVAALPGSAAAKERRTATKNSNHEGVGSGHGGAGNSATGGDRKNGWESLWSAEFSVESPTKKG